MDFFNEKEEVKSKYLVQVRHWGTEQCISFLSNIRQRYHLASQIQIPSHEVLGHLSLVELKTWVIKMVQSCEDISQLDSYEDTFL